MKELARQRLCAMLAQFGVGICKTTRSCGMFLASACQECPEEGKLLTIALEHDVPTQLLHAARERRLEESSRALTENLVNDAGMSPEDARWAVDSWSIALGCHPASQGQAEPAPMLAPDQQTSADGDAAAISHLLSLVILGAAGVIGAVLPWAIVFFVFFAIDFDPSKTQRGHAAEIALASRYLILLMSGGASGMGAMLGWFAANGGRLPSPLEGEQMGNRVWRAAFAAASGAAFSSLVAGFCCGVPGLVVFGFFGAFGAATKAGMR